MQLAALVSEEHLSELISPFADTPMSVRIESSDGETLAAAGETRRDAAGASTRREAAAAASGGVQSESVVCVPISAGSAGVVGQVVVSQEGRIDSIGRAAASSLAIALGTLAQAAPRTERRATERSQRELEHGREHDRIEAELTLSRRLQRSFVPLVTPEVEGWDIASHYEPARQIGGDFFDVFRIRERGRRLGLVIADVTGKGIAAAMLMAFTRPLLRSAVDRLKSPGEALARTNEILVDERRTALFITALIAVVEPRTGRAQVAAAGHEPPLIWRAATGSLEELGVEGPLLGAFRSIQLRDLAITLQPRDVLICYTDGVTDAQSPRGERFGMAQFEDAIRSATEPAAGPGGAASAREIVDNVLAAMERFQAGTPAADDVTLLVARRLPRRAGRHEG